MSSRSIQTRIAGAYARRMAKWFGRRPATLAPDRPVITFTFDDFPRSAAIEGRAILEEFGSLGTYFIAYGLMGQSTATGEIFQAEDVHKVIERGHELGCHTYDHLPAWSTPPAAYEQSVKRNATSLKSILGTSRLQSHSFPISYPRPSTKRRLSRRFRACRGGGQTFNAGSVDLNYLSSFFLEQSRDNLPAVERIIAANAAAGGWLIFSTHDISPNPTRFGCTPTFFAQVVQIAARSGARIQSMSSALDAKAVPQLSE